MKDIIGYFYYYLFLAILILVGFLSGDLDVKASTSWSVNQSRIVTDFNGTYTFSSWSNQSSAYTPTDPVVGLQYRVKVSGGAIADNSYVFRVAYKSTPDSLYSTSPVLVDNNGDPRSDYVCTSFNYNTSDGYYKSTCTFTPQTNMSTSDYLYVRIWFEGGGSYVSSLAIGLSAYDIRQGTGSIITDMGNDIINSINDNFTNQCSNLYNYNNYGTSGVSNINVYNNYDVSFTGSGNVKLSENLSLARNTHYNFSYHVSASNSISQLVGIWCVDSGGNWSEIYNRTFTGTNATYTDEFYTTNTICSYYRFEYNGYNSPSSTNFSLSKIMLSTESANYCVYGSTSNKLDEQTNAINDLDDSIKDDSIDNPDDFFDDFNDMLPTNNTISSLIALPITLYTKILNGISGTCSSINLGSLYGTNLILPCVNIGQYLGNTLWVLIDTIFSGMTVYFISKSMIKAFNNFTSLKEGDVIDG